MTVPTLGSVVRGQFKLLADQFFSQLETPLNGEVIAYAIKLGEIEASFMQKGKYTIQFLYPETWDSIVYDPEKVHQHRRMSAILRENRGYSTNYKLRFPKKTIATSELLNICVFLTCQDTGFNEEEELLAIFSKQLFDSLMKM